MALLADPVGVVTDGMTFQERCDTLSGSVYNYDDYCDNSPDYFDYYEPGDFDGYPDVYRFIGPMSMSCVMFFMDRMTVGRIVCLGEMPR